MTTTKKPGRILDYDKKLPVLELYVCIQSGVRLDIVNQKNIGTPIFFDCN